MNNPTNPENYSDLSIQWFPGHMTKTLRMIEKEIQNVDMVIEITDARIPAVSRSPEVVAATRGKKRLIVLNKCDLADDAATSRWILSFEKQGFRAIAVDSTKRRSAEQAKSCILQLAERRPPRTGVMKPRAMVVGVPNCGKSTFINCLAGERVAKAEDRPGVTRGKQWISLDFVELLDVPGVLCKRFDDQSVAAKLAFTGAIRDDILDTELLAVKLLDVLKTGYAERLTERYGIAAGPADDSYELLESAARRRGKLLRGAQPDTERAAAILLDEYRAGKLGRITLEEPENGK